MRRLPLRYAGATRPRGAAAGPRAPRRGEDEEGGGVGGVGTGEQLQAGNGERRRDLRLLAQDRAEGGGYRFGTRERRAHGESHEADQVAGAFSAVLRQQPEI